MLKMKSLIEKELQSMNLSALKTVTVTLSGTPTESETQFPLHLESVWKMQSSIAMALQS